MMFPSTFLHGVLAGWTIKKNWISNHDITYGRQPFRIAGISKQVSLLDKKREFHLFTETVIDQDRKSGKARQ